jgi:hypothetical protein
MISVPKRGAFKMILCFDFAGKMVKVIGVKKNKKKLQILWSRELPLSDLAKFLEEDQIFTAKEIQEIRISGALENTFHKAFVVPNMKKKMLHSTVETEVIRAFGNDYQFKEMDLGEVRGPGNKVNRKIMTVGLKRDTLEELSRIFANSKNEPGMYTTYPMALKTLLERLGALGEDPLAFMELNNPVSRVVVFRGEEIRLTRELPTSDKEKDSENSALAKDIYRTLLFYNDSYPEERVKKIMFAGSLTSPEIEKNSHQKTAAEIIPFAPENFFHTVEGQPELHPGCLGLALLNPERCDFAFVPFSVQEKRKVKKNLALSISTSLGILLLFALIISRFSLDLRNLDMFHRGIHGEIRMKEDRLKEMSLEFISQSIETSQPPWSEILLELAAVVPQGVALKTFTLKKVKRNWLGEVTGIAEGEDEINSLLQVEEMQTSFVQSPLFKGVKLVERELKGRQVKFKIIYQLDI